MQIEKIVKVSVCVITYNQEKYIARCLQSIVDQKTDFDFEVIVSDDCSTDATPEIIKHFAELYPNLIKPIFHKKNFGDGGFSNYTSVHKIAKSEYVAHIDGDDCMMPLKLLKQVNYLDRHENCPLVAHRMEVWQNGVRINITKDIRSQINMPKLLLEHPMFLHSSIMYRRSVISHVYDEKDPFIDYYVYMFALKYGDIGFINEALGKYTNSVGVSKNRNLMPFIQKAIDLAIGRVPLAVIDRARSKQYLSYAVSALVAQDNLEFISNITLAKRYGKHSIVVNLIFQFRRNSLILSMIINFYKKYRLIKFSVSQNF